MNLKSIPWRKIIVYSFYVLFWSCLQVSFPNSFSLFGQVADLMLVFVCLTAYFFGFFDGIVIGLCTGLLRDIFAGPVITGLDGKVSTTVGIGMLLMFGVAVLSASFFTERMNRNVFFAFVAIVVATVGYKIAGHLLGALWTTVFLGRSYGISPVSIIVRSVLPQVLLNILAGIPVAFTLKVLGPYKRGYGKIKKDDEIRYGDDKWLTI